MHHRDRSFILEQTAINFHIDELSRTSSAPTVVGRKTAMAAASHNDQCHQCKAFGHYQRDCPWVAMTNGSKRKPKKGKKGRIGDPHPSGVPTTNDPSPKWCFCHKTNSHSDSQCHKKKELKQLAAHLADLRSTDQARLANIGSAHLAQTSQLDPPTFGFSFLSLIHI